MIALQIIISIYIIGSILVGSLFALAVYRVGSFKDFAELANTLGPAGVKKFNSEKVQWMILLMVVFWPVFPLLLKVGSKSVDTTDKN